MDLQDILRLAQSGARGFTTGLLGAPVDIANMAMGGVGGQKPVMGSEWIGDKLQNMGLLAPPATDLPNEITEFAGGLLNPLPAGAGGKMLLGGLLGARPMKVKWSPGGGSQTLKVGKTTLDYGIASDGSSAEVIMLHTPPKDRGQGGGRKAMETFLSEADRQGAEVRLHAQPMPNYGARRPDAGDTTEGALGLRALRRFYESLGFKPAGGDLMVRKPQP